MLDHCAPDYRKREGKHTWIVMVGDRTYPTLPLGDHGPRTNPEIQVGHIRKMCNFFNILACAKTHLKTLDR